MFRFIRLVVLIGFIMVFGNMNLLAAKANDAEMHYFRGVEHYMHKQYHLATLEFGKALKLKPNYTEAQSAFKVAYAKAGGGSSASLGYGCLGAYQGALLASAAGCLASDVRVFVIGSVLGIAIGGYLGSKAETSKQKEYVIGCAIIATAVFVYVMRRTDFNDLYLSQISHME